MKKISKWIARGKRRSVRRIRITKWNLEYSDTSADADTSDDPTSSDSSAPESESIDSSTSESDDEKSRKKRGGGRKARRAKKAKAKSKSRSASKHRSKSSNRRGDSSSPDSRKSSKSATGKKKFPTNAEKYVAPFRKEQKKADREVDDQEDPPKPPSISIGWPEDGKIPKGKVPIAYVRTVNPAVLPPGKVAPPELDGRRTPASKESDGEKLAAAMIRIVKSSTGSSKHVPKLDKFDPNTKSAEEHIAAFEDKMRASKVGKEDWYTHFRTTLETQSDEYKTLDAIKRDGSEPWKTYKKWKKGLIKLKGFKPEDATLARSRFYETRKAIDEAPESWLDRVTSSYNKAYPDNKDKESRDQQKKAQAYGGADNDAKADMSLHEAAHNKKTSWTKFSGLFKAYYSGVRPFKGGVMAEALKGHQMNQEVDAIKLKAQGLTPDAVRILKGSTQIAHDAANGKGNQDHISHHRRLNPHLSPPLLESTKAFMYQNKVDEAKKATPPAAPAAAANKTPFKPYGNGGGDNKRKFSQEDSASAKGAQDKKPRVNSVQQQDSMEVDYGNSSEPYEVKSCHT